MIHPSDTSALQVIVVLRPHHKLYRFASHSIVVSKLHSKTLTLSSAAAFEEAMAQMPPEIAKMQKDMQKDIEAFKIAQAGNLTLSESRSRTPRRACFEALI
jgi:hypothetical protein